MGGSSGGGGHTPYEAPDSLKSAQRLRAMGLISLGPIRGAVTPDKYESAFFDNTPLKNAQGEWNYQNTEISYNLGTQDQLPLEGFEMSEREVPVSAEVKFDHPLSRRVIDPDITRLRITLGVNALFEQNDQGDTYGTNVDLQVLINGQHKESITIDGKSSSRFHRSYILDNLPPVPFTITVKRLTADSKSQRLQNSTFWSSYTEIIDTKLSYPNMAMVGIKTDSRYNPNFPNINFLLYGRLVKVPSNYDPDTRTYAAGIWKGDFKLAWTNNPAWVFYDLVTNKLAGLGQRLGDYGVDKFQLYQIAQYCDQLVPDGYGGFEPRMVANLWITDQRDAYSVISDMASVFRAIAVWNGVQFTAIQDRPSDPVCTYTQANVIEGKFNRQYAPLKSIFTAVEVEFADEKNFYQKAIEYVADDSMIDRYGYNVKKMVAFACTSRGQARRYGKWVLETSRLEQCTINFSVGRDGLQIIPGDIIEVADKSYANLNLGGRVIAVSGRQVTLDAPIETEGESYLSYLSEDKRLVRRKISQIDRQNKALVTLDAEPVGLKPMDLWTLHTPLVSTQRYRVLTIAENDNGSYTITALQHVPQKEAIVDDGAVFEPSTESLHQVPSQLTYVGVEGTHSGGMRIAWESSSANGILTYDIKVIKDGSLYLFKKGESSNTLALDDLPNGEYLVTIIARNQQGKIVSEKTESFTVARPPVPKNISVMGGLSEISLAWDYVDNITQTEIFASETNDISTAKRIAKVLASFYSHAVGARQTRYYWLRHTRGQNVGDFYQQQGLRAETGADIDEELRLLNEKLSEPIINQVFDVAAPARRLEMILTVDNITDPSRFLNHKQLYNEADGKLWTWNKTKNRYEPESSEILASAIRGIIQPDQLASIPTAKISGKITNEMLQSVEANKLAGVIDVDRLPAVPTTKLSGNIPKERILELEATKLLGELPIANVPSIPSNKLTGLLTSSQIQSLDATKLSGTINLARLPSIPTTNLTGKISSDMLQSVSASKIDGTIDLGKIPSIPTTKLGGVLGLNQLPNLPTNKITGVFSTSQLPSIPTNKLTGTLTDAQLQGISASKITGTINVNQLASIPTTKLTGQIQANQLAVNSVGANVIQANAIGSQHIQANSIDAGKIRANAIGAEHINAGAITTDKFAVGLGGNLLFNPILANDGDGWSSDNGIYSGGVITKLYRAKEIREWGFQNPISDVERILVVTFNENITSTKNQWANVIKQRIHLVPNRWYIFSAYVNTYRCAGAILVDELNSLNGSSVRTLATSPIHNRGSFYRGVDEHSRNFVKFRCPISGYVEVMVRVTSMSARNPDIYIARLMLEECTEHATQPSTWQNAGVTLIHGGSIKTRTVTAEQIQANAITANEIASNAIQTKHLTANVVTAEKIQANAIGVNHLGANVVTAEKIQAGAVNAQKIASNAIESGHIKSNAIASNHIQSNAITADKILANAITSQKITANAITGLHLAVNAVKAVHITANSIETSKIKAGAVTASQIAANAITADKILANAVNAEKIASDAIQAKHIQANAIGANAIQAGVIGATHIEANSIDATKIKANSIGANAIQANAITTDKIQANAITTAKIETGAINSHHIQAGQISADKLAIGLGGNLLYNPIFANNGEGWDSGGYTHVTNIVKEFTHNDNWVTKQRYLPTENLGRFTFRCDNSNLTMGQYVFWLGQTNIPVSKGKSYIFSAYTSAHRCNVMLSVNLYSGDNTLIHTFRSNYAQSNLNFHDTIDNADRLSLKFTVPTNRDVVRANVYFICLKDGNFDNSILFAMRPMLEECGEYATQASTWQNAGVTLIHGGSIKTRTVKAEQIQANAITANEIAANAITAKHITTGTINAQHIHTRAISADKLNIQSLSAISANLGTITGGSLNINNRFKVSAEGRVEMRATTGNVGMVINNDNLIVCDQRGRVRVKIGKL